MEEVRILIVEDEGIVAKDIQNRLKKLGYSVAGIVASGEDAVKKAEETRPDLVLMDIKLKGEMNGIGAAEQIRKKFDIPVIYLTAYADEDTIERAKVTEPFGYMLKPFEERELRSNIEMALYKHKMEKRLRESKQWLATTLKSIGDAVIATDEKGCVAFMNPVAESLTGWKQEEAIGKKLTEVFNIINEKTRALAENPVERVLREGVVVGLANHTVLIARDGREIPIDDSAAPIKDDKGNITGVVLVFRDISERKEMTEAFRESEEKFRGIAAAAKDAIIMLDNNGCITYWNPAAERIFGYTAEEAVGKEAHLLLAPRRYHEAYEKGFSVFRMTGQGPALGNTLEFLAMKKDGTEFPIEASVSAIQIKGQWHAVGIIRDITERKRAKEALQKSEKFLSTIFDSIRDPFSIVDRDYRIVRVNAAYAQIKNKPIETLVGKKCYEILYGRDSVCEDCVVEKTFSSSDPCAKDKRITLPDGAEIWLEIYTYPLFNEEGVLTHVIEYTRDITTRKKAEEERKRLIERLEHLSRTDGLTGLLNRRALLDKLEYEVDRAKRYGSELSVILCDVDSFKEINDTYGHAAGDKILRAVSETLSESLRRTDIAGRYGGDEFMLILPETSINGAVNFAERIRLALGDKEFQFTDKRLTTSLSLGVTSLRENDDTDTLIKRADIAMYASKRSGKNKVCAL
jgi:diguanylate cyclase (GGDEF)-like protein/PAS domain S-box-containing protein